MICHFVAGRSADARRGTGKYRRVAAGLAPNGRLWCRVGHRFDEIPAACAALDVFQAPDPEGIRRRFAWPGRTGHALHQREEPGMLQFDFDKSVGYWVFATAHQLACAMNEELQSLGITHRQWEVLAWLSYESNLAQSELAERMGIEAPTLVGVLDRMERDGWIVRVPSETDRRKKLIRPTERVEPVWAQMVQCGLRVRTKATQGLSEEQLKNLRLTLTTMRRNLLNRPPSPASQPAEAVAAAAGNGSS